MLNIKEVADEADVIVNGYAFKRCEEGFQVLNLHRPNRAVVFSQKVIICTLLPFVFMNVCMFMQVIAS